MKRALRLLKDDAVTFPRLLRHKRERDGLTQTALAGQIGCTQQRIAAWETRGERPTQQFYPSLIAYLDLGDEANLLRLLNQQPARQTLARSIIDGPIEPVTASEAIDMLATLGRIYLQRGDTMSSEELRIHATLGEFYKGILNPPQ